MQGESEKMEKGAEKQKQPPNISPMEPLTHDAYGGGLYGADDEPSRKLVKPPASTRRVQMGQRGPTSSPSTSHRRQPVIEILISPASLIFSK